MRSPRPVPTGPLELTVMLFAGETPDARMAPVLAGLEATGAVRMVDAAFVAKDAEGRTGFAELSDSEVGAAYRPHGLTELLNDADLVGLADRLEPGSSGLVVLWESRWATALAQAAESCGGRLTTVEQVPQDQVSAALAWAPEGAA